MQRGFFYLVVIMDWYSRFVLSWELSMMDPKNWTGGIVKKRASIAL
jgi:hypothetical protein